VPIREIADVIGRHLDVPVTSVSHDDAADHFGWLAAFLAADIPASSELTRDQTGWQPPHTDLLADLDAGHYFQAVAA
jgi:hypothetical protein